MGEKLGEMGRKLDEKLNSLNLWKDRGLKSRPRMWRAGAWSWQRHADGEGIGKAIDAIKKSIDGDQNPKGGDR